MWYNLHYLLQDQMILIIFNSFSCNKRCGHMIYLVSRNQATPSVESSKVLMAVINFLFKSANWSLLLLGSAKFTFDMTLQSQQGSCWKDAARVKFTFTCGFGHVSEAVYTMCANPKKLFQQVTHRNQLSVLHGQYDFINFCNLCPLILKKGGFTPVLTNRKKDFSLENSNLGWKSTTCKAAFQSNFKF